jgi:hypothetical protein
MNSSDSVDFKACMEQATHFAAQLRIVHILYLVLLAFVADYVWMLSMRWRMVRSFPSHCRLTYVALTKSQPPGPFPWPICGNTFSLPNEKPWYYFEQLSKDYNSPLITFWLGRFVTSTRPSALRSLNRYRRPTVWINDAWAANELLVKKANIYNSRPRMLMFAELGVGQANLLHKYTYTKEQRERFRDLRKITHHGVGIQQVPCVDP